MKITHVCKVWFPRITGVTVHVQHLAKLMAESGNNVTVCSFDYENRIIGSQKEISFHQDNYNVRLVRPGDLQRLEDIFHDVNPEIIHAHGIWEHVAPAWRSAKKLNSKFFLTAHGTWQFLFSTPGMEHWRRRLSYRWYYITQWRKMVCQADGTIALNEIEEKAFRRLGGKRIFRIPNGVDCSLFSPNALCMNKIFPPKSYLFFAGSIQQQKGIFTALQSMVLLQQKGISVPLVIAGVGPESEKAFRFSLENSLNAHFLGQVDREEMPGLMAGALAFILPSQYEPFATVYLEAMASGTPCIGTNTGGTPEIIINGETGFLVKQNDSCQLAHHIEQILTNPNISTSIKNRAVERAHHHFDWSIIVPRILTAYKK